jgi:hypothetical protein
MVAHRKVCLRLRRQAAVLLPVHTLIPSWPSARTFALPPKTQSRWLRAIATAPMAGDAVTQLPRHRSVPMVAICKDRGRLA